MHATRFEVSSVEPPLPLPNFRLNAVAPKVALLDAGLAWLLEALATTDPNAERLKGGFAANSRMSPNRSRGASKSRVWKIFLKVSLNRE